MGKRNNRRTIKKIIIMGVDEWEIIQQTLSRSVSISNREMEWWLSGNMGVF